jgi:hypothetical protein
MNILPRLLTISMEPSSSWEACSSSASQEIPSAVFVIGLADVLGA